MPRAGGSVNYVYHILEGIDDMDYTVLTADLDHDCNVVFDRTYGHHVIRSKWIAHVLDNSRGGWLKRNVVLLISILLTFFYIVRLRPRMIIYTDYTFLTISYFFARPFVKSKLGLFTYAEEIQQILNKPFHLFVLKKVLKDSNFLVTVCEYTKKMLCEIVDGIEHKITIIIPPVNVILAKPQIRNGKKGIRLLTVARLEERKGHIDVLNVLKRLLPKYPDLHYTIVGKGPFEKEIRNTISNLSLDAYVDMKGRVSEEELEEEYQNADIFVMPHKQLKNGDTEGCPTVFLEAGLYNLPVIGGEAGGVSDAIKDGETGFICHKGTDELYEYIEKLIEDVALRDNLGEAGRNYASLFSTKAQAGLFRKIVQLELY